MKVEIFDTTLRDGIQGEGVSLSVADKLQLVQEMDAFGIDLIEGGWPGSNPRDEAFFSQARGLDLKHAAVCAFGSTARQSGRISEDPNLQALLKAGTEAVTIFGKTWRFHSSVGLGLSDEANAALIHDSVAWMKHEGRRVIFDAEHFFDGYHDDPEFALTMLKAAEDGGADTIVLCDTNGGSMPDEIAVAVREVRKTLQVRLGIHAHNDGGLAIANSLLAVREGVSHIQGTIGGVGERCGNADLAVILPNLIMKMGRETEGAIELDRLTEFSRTVSEIMNMQPDSRAPFVGKSAFAHKGGVHVNAVMKDVAMYEHIEPEQVGNRRRVLISDLSGKSNIEYKARELGFTSEETTNTQQSREMAQWIKEMEYEGYQFDGAEASFELLMHGKMGDFKSRFELVDSYVHVHSGQDRSPSAVATLKVEVDGKTERTAAEGVGPVHAMDLALRKALKRFFPEISRTWLVDYKVRVIDEKRGTSAKVRVLITTSDGQRTWSTVGVSENIIEASWLALRDSLNYLLYKLERQPEPQLDEH